MNDQESDLSLTIILTLLGGKFTEIVTYIIVVVAYVLTMCRTCKVKIKKMPLACMSVLLMVLCAFVDRSFQR